MHCRSLFSEVLSIGRLLNLSKEWKEDNLHDMSKPIFCEHKKTIISLSSAELLNVIIEI